VISLKEIPLKTITFGERFREDYGDLSDLVASFKKEGVIQPLAVCEQEDGSYLLLAGGRRYMAADKAGLESVPVRCYPATLSELERRSIELMENICRKDMDWLEAAKLKKEIHNLQVAIHGEKISTAADAPGHSKRDTAALLGVAPSTVVQDINLATAVEMFPALAKAKNKNEASKMLQKFQENLIRGELANRIASKTADTPIERIHMNLINSFILGDFFEGVKNVPDKSIDFIELDPPYAIDLNAVKRDMGTRSESYNEVERVGYASFLCQLFKECERVMSTNSWMVIWHAKEWFQQIIDTITPLGLFGSDNTMAIWYKGNVGQTNMPNLYLASSYEQLLYVRKGLPSIVRQGRSNVFNYKPVASAKKIHPTERPVELIQDIMQTFCWDGARCMVPFLGSGNSILAASNLGMAAFGWELSKEYKDGYIMRVGENRPTGYRSYKEQQNA